MGGQLPYPGLTVARSECILRDKHAAHWGERLHSSLGVLEQCCPQAGHPSCLLFFLPPLAHPLG